MKKAFFGLAAILFLVAWTSDKKQAKDVVRTFNVMLSGSQEVVVCDADGSGTAMLTFNKQEGTLTYQLMVSDVDGVTAAHLHEAPAGTAGPVVVGLRAPVNGMSSGVVRLSKDQIKEILKNPEDYYVNVHSEMCEAGAVRGQLE